MQSPLSLNRSREGLSPTTNYRRRLYNEPLLLQNRIEEEEGRISRRNELVSLMSSLQNPFLQLSIRIVIVILFLLLLASQSAMSFLNSAASTECIADSLLDLFATQNSFFGSNAIVMEITLVTSSMLVDIMVLAALFRFAFKTLTWRFAVAIGLFGVIRLICSVIEFAQ